MSNDTELWPFTQMVIEELKRRGRVPNRVDGHDVGDNEGGDFLFGELTPHLSLSEGEYMCIDQDVGLMSYQFGAREGCGGDPTYGGEFLFEPTSEKAVAVAQAFIDYFDAS